MMGLSQPPLRDISLHLPSCPEGVLRGSADEEALGKFPVNRARQVKTAKLGFKVFGAFAKQILQMRLIRVRPGHGRF